MENFAKFVPQLLKEFSLKATLSPISKQIRQEKNSVAVHIRRGDYVGNKKYDVIDMDYFIRAAKYMKKQLKNPVFFIFSDDIDWVKKTLI